MRGPLNFVFSCLEGLPKGLVPQSPQAKFLLQLPPLRHGKTGPRGPIGCWDRRVSGEDAVQQRKYGGCRRTITAQA